ncbi:MAG: precorrin-8X methylmutase [Actinomycetota bacterium]|nr:precorrin-8X methylmutase [Actinomycetota bacterium]
MTVHPIETQSYRILAERVDLSGLGPGARAVVSRVIHASADVEYASTMVVDEAAVEAGVAALRRGAPVVADVEMVAAGIKGIEAVCYLAAATAGDGVTRSAAAMRIAAGRHPEGAVVVVGCAPTALAEVVDLWTAGAFHPAMVVGLPVGFVGAAEAKEALRRAGPGLRGPNAGPGLRGPNAGHALASVTNVGEKGGSAVAAAAVNAMVRLARG